MNILTFSSYIHRAAAVNSCVRDPGSPGSLSCVSTFVYDMFLLHFLLLQVRTVLSHLTHTTSKYSDDFMLDIQQVISDYFVLNILQVTRDYFMLHLLQISLTGDSFMLH